ncbi:hypothetical protein SAMN04488117_12131 [Celeribacter baekdonensis]|uniref:Uncharacterized protein n=1 Tax=Celeribacter baekdonensis TaxID=875171 RepID=A0A1G7UCC0_9RHOB|nr:hypothetical protein [Celeribacter baekdonensis]SDG45107.1 hypothetical protein SAMN04488117_12131 [Celeribacter baekdonensis]
MTDKIEIIEHDSWAYNLPKTRTAGKITIGDIPGVLPFSGVRNPLTTSSTSQSVALTYRTAANNFVPKVGAAESLAEAAVAHEALSSGRFYDVEFQPVRFPYEHPDGGMHWHTIDFRFTLPNGLMCFGFVRNATSLLKPQTIAEITAIRQAAPRAEAHKFIVIDADGYNRARRDNLRRMHHFACFEPDPSADALVEAAAYDLKTLWRVSDLFNVVDLPNGTIMKSCLRLIARGALKANMNAVIGAQSRIWSAAK